jgi:hypothetical protein
MTTQITPASKTDAVPLAPLEVTHVIRGRASRPSPDDVVPGSRLVAPALHLDQLIWTRDDGLPAERLSVEDIYDFLGAAGDVIRAGTSPHMKAAIESLARLRESEIDLVQEDVRNMSTLFRRNLLQLEVEQNLGPDPYNWHARDGYEGERFAVRAVPVRQLHIMAGNGVKNAAVAVIRTALSRGVSLLKLPSNDPFTAPALLQVLADLDPQHPVVQSLSAVYWRGGDSEVESVLVRPQYFEKIVAWGGQATMENIVRYLGPGLDLVAFDPKTSISIIAGLDEVTPEELTSIANRSADDVRTQEGCANARHQFVEGTTEQVDAYCRELVDALRRQAHRNVGPTPPDIVDEAEGLRGLEPDFAVFGSYDGNGLVIRSDRPVDFYPENRTVNVVQLDDIADAAKFVGSETQTCGVYPPAVKFRLRDALTTAGVDRLCDLGDGNPVRTADFGAPHDGFWALNRMVRWVSCQLEEAQ